MGVTPLDTELTRGVSVRGCRGGRAKAAGERCGPGRAQAGPFTRQHGLWDEVAVCGYSEFSGTWRWGGECSECSWTEGESPKALCPRACCTRDSCPRGRVTGDLCCRLHPLYFFLFAVLGLNSRPQTGQASSRPPPHTPASERSASFLVSPASRRSGRCGICDAVKAGIELSIFLPLSPEGWGYRCAPYGPHLV